MLANKMDRQNIYGRRRQCYWQSTVCYLKVYAAYTGVILKKKIVKCPDKVCTEWGFQKQTHRQAVLVTKILTKTQNQKSTTKDAGNKEPGIGENKPKALVKSKEWDQRKLLVNFKDKKLQYTKKIAYKNENTMK